MESAISKNIRNKNLKSSNDLDMSDIKLKIPIKPITSFPNTPKNNSIYAKAFLISFLALFFVSVITFSIYYYLVNFTPEAILQESLKNFVDDTNLKFDGNFKLTFSYSEKREEIYVGDIEVYTLLRKSPSDSHEIAVTGNLDRSIDPPETTFDLRWNMSNVNAFKIDGSLRGYNLNFKVSPYIFEETIEGRLKNEYSTIDTKILLEKVFPERDLTTLDIENLKNFDFEITETFPDDKSDGEKVSHHKILVKPKNASGTSENQILIHDLDIWVKKKSRKIIRIKGSLDFRNIGIEANKLEIFFDVKFK